MIKENKSISGNTIELISLELGTKTKSLVFSINAKRKGN